MASPQTFWTLSQTSITTSLLKFGGAPVMTITIDQATKVKELTVASQTDVGKPSTLVLTDTSLYVNRSSDREWRT